MAGVTICNGSIIAINSTIKKNVAPYTIVGGNPAIEIKKRFSDENIAKLLEIKWWNWDIDKITKNTQLLTGNNIDNS